MALAGCRLPKVMLLTYLPTERAKRFLESEDWDVRVLPRLPNPFDDRGEMTRQTFSMLWAYSLTEFSKILYIDVDFIVLHNLDDLFQCGDWCAAETTRETMGRFNAGLQVLSPNKTLFQDMVRLSREGHFTSYNRGVQGFLNEAIPTWCSHGEVKSWFDLRAAGERRFYRACRNLPPDYNHIAVVVPQNLVNPTWWPPSRTAAELYGSLPRALHFNHPVFWAIKPWLWWWYPLLPANWVWWQFRREVAGEHWWAAATACAGVLAPLLLSLAFVLIGPRGAPHRGLAAAVCAEGRCSRPGCLQRHTARALALSVGSSILVFLVLPGDTDALVAWASYFTLKGCALGLGLGLSSPAGLAEALQRGSPGGFPEGGGGQLRRLQWAARFRWVICGYLCEVAEAAIVWGPQAQGLHWVSDKALYPVCQFTFPSESMQFISWNALGCTATLWVLLAGSGVLCLCIQLLLLWPAWRGTLRIAMIVEPEDLEKQK